MLEPFWLLPNLYDTALTVIYGLNMLETGCTRPSEK